MEDEKFELLMSEIRKTSQKVNASIAKLKREVATAQERTAREAE